MRLSADHYYAVDADGWNGTSEEDGRADLELADGYLSVVNGAKVAWSDGETWEACRAATDWRSSVRVGSANGGSSGENRAIRDGDTLCLTTSEHQLAGLTATGVANFGNDATLGGSTWDYP